MISQHTQLSAPGQLYVHAGFYLCRGGVLQVRASFHVIHLRVIDQKLLHGSVGALRHVVHGHAVVVFLVGIEITQSRCLAVEADTGAERQPSRHVEREVDARAEGCGTEVGERLLGREAQADLRPQVVDTVGRPHKVILSVGSELMEPRDVGVGTWTTVGVGTQRTALVEVEVPASVVPVVVVFSTHLEALPCLAPVEIEVVGNLGKDVSRSPFRLAGGEIALCGPAHGVVACLHGRDDGQQSAGHGDEGGVAAVLPGIAHAEGIGQVA